MMIIISSINIKNFRIDASSDTLVAKNDKDFLYFKSYSKLFTSENFLILAVKINSKVFVLLGDGELNEGMIWEACMFSSHNKLDNLIAIIDYNRLQGFGTTDEILNLDPLDKKFNAFGWKTEVINGHNIDEIISIMQSLPLKTSIPTAIIANTIKGKGVKSMENKLHSHYEILTKERYEEIINELDKFN